MRENLGLLMTKRARISRNQEALVELERARRYSYAELNARVNRAANALLAMGVGSGDRVALLLMNGVEFVEAYFGGAKIGAVVVPLNWRLVADELEFILNDSTSRVLLHDPEFAETVGALRERELPVEHWIETSLEGDAGSWQALCAAAPDREPEIGAEGDDELFIMYTSGTTGQPKGVVHTHSSMLWASLTTLTTVDLRADDRYLQVLPLFHVGALTPMTAGLHRGGSIVMMRAFDPGRIFGTIEEERINCMFAVPAMLQFMWITPGRESSDLSTLRWIMSGAAPLPVPTIEQYAGMDIPVHQVYGLTESCGPACVISSADAIRKAGSTGQPFVHTDIRIVDPEGADVGAGEVGEILIRGPHLMKEYWNRPDASAETLRDGWLYTGDLASQDEEGFVYIQDRKKDMIISGGENIYPAEIEEALRGHPKVFDVAVIGMKSARWGESPAAIVVPMPGEALTAGEVIEYAGKKLARFKVPQVVELVEAIPRNPTGKILKRVLRDQFPGPAPE